MDTIDLSGTIGLVATCVLTGNILLGMMLSTGYKARAWWQRLPPFIRRQDINAIHNWTAYIALALAGIHFLLIPLDPASKFHYSDLLWPLQAPHQPTIVLLGWVALLALLAVLVSTQKPLKRKMGFRAWKNLHLISYITALLFILHGLLMDPELKDRPTDWLDAEKLLSELCGLLLIAASVWRCQYHLASKKK